MMKIRMMMLFAIIILIMPYDNFAQGWKLVWSDEFEGTTLDPSNWTRETGGGGWGNNELQYYTDREVNSFVSNGKLTIKAMQESFGGRNYTSARLKTQGKRFFKYGKIEAYIKLPYGQGIWPAFWMLGESISSVGWPGCGEIDIMEMIGGGPGRDNTVHGTVHWDNNGHQSYGQSYTLPTGNLSDAFHLYTITWDSQKIEWFIDNIKFCTISITPSYLSEFKENHFIIMNIAVGGNWPGNPNASTVFPQTMQIDYVRVYKDTLGLPSINMLSPEDGSIFTPGETINLTANVTSATAIRKVEFFQDAVKIGETSVSPYILPWRGVQPGCYRVKAVATSISGGSSETEPVTLKVGDQCEQASFRGYRQKVPGRIEAENFDLGGNGVAYYDVTSGNTGGVYRALDAVDIQNCTDAGGGFNIGWVSAGEWLEYSIYAAEPGNYTFTLRTASAAAATGTMRVYIDDVDVSGLLTVPLTGNWQTWANVSKPNIPLTQGNHTLKIFIASGEYNINYADILLTETPVFLRLTSPAGGEVYTAGSVQEITWESAGFSDVAVGLTTNDGATWAPVNNDYPAVFGVIRFQVPSVPSNNCKVMIVDRLNSSLSAVSPASFTITAATGAEESQDAVSDFRLFQNYPNPFNPSTTIRYQLPESGYIRLRIYNSMGQQTAVLVNQPQTAGSHAVSFDASNLPTGVYFCSLVSGGFKQTIQMVLMK